MRSRVSISSDDSSAITGCRHPVFRKIWIARPRAGTRSPFKIIWAYDGLMPVASQSSRAVGVLIRQPSHIVEALAIRNFHSLYKARSNTTAHNVEMDKNGGPNNLRAWREFRKLSQETLGEKVGTTGTVISMLESGDRGLSAKWLRKLATALNIQPGHLLDHDPNDLSTDILEIWMNADSDQKRQLIDVAKALVRVGSQGR